MELCPEFSKLDRFCPIELMLISQMFIAAKMKGAQHGLKGHCVLVPTEKNSNHFTKVM